MALKRYNIQLAFPEPISPSLAGRLVAFEKVVKAILPDAVIINEGEHNEEDTTKAQWHRCLHDEGRKCEDAQDI